MLLAARIVQNEIQTPAFLGESWGFWCQFLVILATGIGALITAYSAMKTANTAVTTVDTAIKTLEINEKRARRQATINLVLSENQDEKFRDVKEKYANLRVQENGFTILVCEQPTCEDRKKKIEESKEILITILNQYEFIAAAIFEDSLDEDLYKRMKKSVLIRDWEALEGFVLELRKQEKRYQLFCETERLALKWKNEKSE